MNQADASTMPPPPLKKNLKNINGTLSLSNLKTIVDF